MTILQIISVVLLVGCALVAVYGMLRENYELSQYADYGIYACLAIFVLVTILKI